MLRELNTNEMDMVSGGTYEVSVTTRRQHYADFNNPHYNSNIFRQNYASAYNQFGYSGGGGAADGFDVPPQNLPVPANPPDTPDCQQMLNETATMTGGLAGIIAGVGTLVGFIPHPAAQGVARTLQGAGAAMGAGTGAAVVIGCE